MSPPPPAVRGLFLLPPAGPAPRYKPRYKPYTSVCHKKACLSAFPCRWTPSPPSTASRPVAPSGCLCGDAIVFCSCQPPFCRPRKAPPPVPSILHAHRRRAFCQPRTPALPDPPPTDCTGPASAAMLTARTGKPQARHCHPPGISPAADSEVPATPDASRPAGIPLHHHTARLAVPRLSDLPTVSCR